MPYQPHDRGGDTYRPRYSRDDRPPGPPPSMYHFRGAAAKRDHRAADDRQNFTFRSGPRTADRPLLRTRHGSKDEQIMMGMESNGSRFRNLEEMTDSEEAEMEDSDNNSDDRPAAKRMKIVGEQSGQEKPRWSNPDPYTALPAPHETTGKGFSVVKLIRKAKQESSNVKDIQANDDDFISFESLDRTVPESITPSLDGPAESQVPDPDSATRKRKRGDKASENVLSQPRRQFGSDGMVLPQWAAKDGVHPTPWIRSHSKTTAPLALHMEIIDFYQWVKPQDFEDEVRAGVIQRLSKALNRMEPGELKPFGSFAAGLYLPTGDMDLVYLPRGFNRRHVFRDGISSNQLRKYGDFIRSQSLAQNGSIQLIAGAKVPLIKFIERVSGLKVDLSFNNDTGVIANETFRVWKQQYPAMPIITSIIKQFLMIRGLNDVAVGGLGGFSAICLVTSILQHMPASGTQVNLGQVLMEFLNIYGNLFDRENVAIRMDPPGYIDRHSYMPHLFNKDKKGRLTIIDPNRPENNISGGSREIQTIFRCFSKAHQILQDRMADYSNFDHSSGYAFSFLESLVGGNFEAYKIQREILYDLQSGQPGPAPAVVPPPPPPVSQNLIAPPPPPPPVATSSEPAATKKQKKAAKAAARGKNVSKSSTDDTSSTSKPNAKKKKQTKAERRATRLKTLRPELSPFIGASITLDEAIKFGRYQNYNEMDKDLTRRELEMSTN